VKAHLPSCPFSFAVIAAASNTNGGREIKAGLPGSIFKVLVNEGDKVKKGQPVIVIEAMKMEIEVTSPEDGVVSSVKVKQGDTIVNNQVLVTL
jgi:pyruvate carboxylase subunit B